MKINFTKKEYRQLLDLVFIGDWVTSEPLDKDTSPYDALREKIYSYAKEMDCEHLIEYDKNTDQHFETAEFEDSGVMKKLDDYARFVKRMDTN